MRAAFVGLLMMMSAALVGCKDTPAIVPTSATPIPPVPQATPPPAAPAPAPAPSPAPTRSLRVSCPASITLDEVAFCSAEVTIDGRTGPATDGVAWSSSNTRVITTSDWRLTGISIGSATITAAGVGGLSASTTVNVVAGANGTFDAIFTPISNTCLSAIHPVHQGTFTIRGDRGTLDMGETTQTYALTFTVGNGALTRIDGVSSFAGFSFTLDLELGESRTGFTGREDARGADGCAGAYRWLMTRRP